MENYRLVVWRKHRQWKIHF